MSKVKNVIMSCVVFVILMIGATMTTVTANAENNLLENLEQVKNSILKGDTQYTVADWVALQKEVELKENEAEREDKFVLGKAISFCNISEVSDESLKIIKDLVDNYELISEEDGKFEFSNDKKNIILQLDYSIKGGAEATKVETISYQQDSLTKVNYEIWSDGKIYYLSLFA